MKYYTNQIFDQNGNVIKEDIVPWTKDDYIFAMNELDKEITPRRLSDAVLSEEGKTWLQNKQQEIQILRDELSQLED